MSNSIIAEGKTTNEAIENGLKILKVSKNQVDIKVLENENKKSFFSILTPRIVKVELTVKENTKKQERVNIEENNNRSIKEYNSNKEELEEAKKDVEEFLKIFIQKLEKRLEYSVKLEKNEILVNINGEDCGSLIGYRGETLNAMQTIISSIANKKVKERIKIILDIQNYREKREKNLIELAEKVSKTVLRNGKNITLEPMSPYERKIIHSALQENNRIETYSIGEGDNRRVVIAKK